MARRRTDATSPTDRLLADIRAARALLPAEHRALLDHLGTQEAAIEDWPRGVQDLFVTLGERAPSAERLVSAAAVWLDARRTVAFNAPLFHLATAGLSEQSRRVTIAHVAWHEYGHALSVKRSTGEHRRDGVRLLSLLPDRLRDSIAYPDGYRRVEVFDEVIATVYPLMIQRVRNGQYGDPDFLHRDVLRAFKEVIPWPPSR